MFTKKCYSDADLSCLLKGLKNTPFSEQREQPSGQGEFGVYLRVLYRLCGLSLDGLVGFQPSRTSAMPELVKCMMIYPCLTTFCYRSAKGSAGVRQGFHIKPSEPFRPSDYFHNNLSV